MWSAISPGYELVSPCPIPTTITTTPRAPRYEIIYTQVPTSGTVCHRFTVGQLELQPSQGRSSPGPQPVSAVAHSWEPILKETSCQRNKDVRPWILNHNVIGLSVLDPSFSILRRVQGILQGGIYFFGQIYAVEFCLVKILFFWGILFFHFRLVLIFSGISRFLLLPLLYTTAGWVWFLCLMAY